MATRNTTQSVLLVELEISFHCKEIRIFGCMDESSQVKSVKHQQLL